MLNAVKLALRISTNKLDVDIQETIEAGQAELIRLGTSKSLVEELEHPLIRQAVKTYCLHAYASEKQAEGYAKAFEYQADCLSKTYRDEVEGETNV